MPAQLIPSSARAPPRLFSFRSADADNPQGDHAHVDGPDRHSAPQSAAKQQPRTTPMRTTSFPSKDSRGPRRRSSASGTSRCYLGRGDTIAQLTWRAVIMGSVLGGVLSLTNLYIGLKAGWGFGVAITACILSYAIWTGFYKMGLARTQMTILENNCMQSTASAAGYSTGGTLVSAFAAYILLNNADASAAAHAGLGLLPRRARRDHGHPHEAADDQRRAAPLPQRDRRRRDAAGAARHRARRGCARRAPWASPGSLAIGERVLDRRPQAHQRPPGVAPDLHPGRPLQHGDARRRRGSAGRSRSPGTRSSSPPGCSWACGWPSACWWARSLCWMIFVPLAAGPRARGRRADRLPDPGPVDALGRHGLHGHLGDPVGVLPVEERRCARSRVWGTCSRSAAASKRDELAAIETPGSWFVVGQVVSLVALALLAHVTFGMPYWQSVIAVLLSFALALVACRVTGETDTTPVGAMGKITQLTFGALSPGQHEREPDGAPTSPPARRPPRPTCSPT